MHSYLTSELARLHGEDLRRLAEHQRRRRELPRRRLPAVAAWLRTLRSRGSGSPTALPLVPTAMSYPRTGVPVIPRQTGRRDGVHPAVEVVQAAEHDPCPSC